MLFSMKTSYRLVCLVLCLAALTPISTQSEAGADTPATPFVDDPDTLVLRRELKDATDAYLALQLGYVKEYSKYKNDEIAKGEMPSHVSTYSNWLEFDENSEKQEEIYHYRKDANSKADVLGLALQGRIDMVNDVAVLKAGVAKFQAAYDAEMKRAADEYSAFEDEYGNITEEIDYHLWLATVGEGRNIEIRVRKTELDEAQNKLDNLLDQPLVGDGDRTHSGTTGQSSNIDGNGQHSVGVTSNKSYVVVAVLAAILGVAIVGYCAMWAKRQNWNRQSYDHVYDENIHDLDDVQEAVAMDELALNMDEIAELERDHDPGLVGGGANPSAIDSDSDSSIRTDDNV
eukprot:TRINITY_DN6220_c0_g1_i2.p1 TRINITY_DN6220_c0_g1~~TRINITY_DN6220_c0_g1_i2.p1  ORF type:complete len:344 (+),score=83.15 TRINITY_DN6220_c0_g1_i2:202-1233(+)